MKRKSCAGYEGVSVVEIKTVPTDSRPNRGFKPKEEVLSNKEKAARQMRRPYCWGCGKDSEGRKVLSIEEAMEVAHVSFSTLYRWMKMEAIEWAYNHRGERRIYQDSLLRVPAALQKGTSSGDGELVVGEESA